MFPFPNQQKSFSVKKPSKLKTDPFVSTSLNDENLAVDNKNIIIGDISQKSNFESSEANINNIIITNTVRESTSVNNCEENILIGKNVGKILSDADQNILIGSDLGEEILNNGNKNILIGKSINLENGNNNIKIGENISSTSINEQYENNNIFIGKNISKGVNENSFGDKDSNIILGNTSGENLSSGSKNIIIGKNSGNNITSGTNNILIGENNNNNNNSNNIIIGNNSTSSQNNNLLLGNSISYSGNSTDVIIIGNSLNISTNQPGVYLKKNGANDIFNSYDQSNEMYSDYVLRYNLQLQKIVFSEEIEFYSYIPDLDYLILIFPQNKNYIIDNFTNEGDFIENKTFIDYQFNNIGIKKNMDIILRFFDSNSYMKTQRVYLPLKPTDLVINFHTTTNKTFFGEIIFNFYNTQSTSKLTFNSSLNSNVLSLPENFIIDKNSYIDFTYLPNDTILFEAKLFCNYANYNPSVNDINNFAKFGTPI